MTVDKSSKREVRARMEKTGESYSIARKHLLSKREATVPTQPAPTAASLVANPALTTTAPPDTPPSPTAASPVANVALTTTNEPGTKPKRFDPSNFHAASPKPERGDMFVHLETGRRGEITEIPPGGTVEVEVYAGDNLPNDETGRMARAWGVTRAGDFRQPGTLSLDSISVRRPRVGARFGLDTPRGFRSTEVVRHLEQGFVEVRVVGLGTAYTHASTLLDLATREQADPSKWSTLK